MGKLNINIRDNNVCCEECQKIYTINSLNSYYDICAECILKFEIKKLHDLKYRVLKQEKLVERITKDINNSREST